jgi:hypothetical protein
MIATKPAKTDADRSTQSGLNVAARQAKIPVMGHKELFNVAAERALMKLSLTKSAKCRMGWFGRLQSTRPVREPPGDGCVASAIKQEHTTTACSSESSRASVSAPEIVPVPSPVQRILTPNEKIAVAAIDRLNAHQSIVSLFHPKSDVFFSGAKMTVEGYQQEQDIVNLSFPDFRLHYAMDCLQEQADGVTVTVRDVRGRGTHSGAPYSFGPFPPIPARGVVCQNDPE